MFNNLHGHTTIELTNVNTGEKAIIEDNNKVTDFIKEFYNTEVANVNSTPVYWDEREQRENFDAWFKKYTQGLMLFKEVVDENAIWPYGGLTQVGRGTSETTFVTGENDRGIFNSTESIFDYNNKHYRYVWDFQTNQGNGIINAVCLTGIRGGRCGFGNTTQVSTYGEKNQTNNYFQIKSGVHWENIIPPDNYTIPNRGTRYDDWWPWEDTDFPKILNSIWSFDYNESDKSIYYTIFNDINGVSKEATQFEFKTYDILPNKFSLNYQTKDNMFTSGKINTQTHTAIATHIVIIPEELQTILNENDDINYLGMSRCEDCYILRYGKSTWNSGEDMYILKINKENLLIDGEFSTEFYSIANPFDVNIPGANCLHFSKDWMCWTQSNQFYTGIYEVLDGQGNFITYDVCKYRNTNTIYNTSWSSMKNYIDDKNKIIYRIDSQYGNFGRYIENGKCVRIDPVNHKVFTINISTIIELLSIISNRDSDNSSYGDGQFVVADYDNSRSYANERHLIYGNSLLPIFNHPIIKFVSTCSTYYYNNANLWYKPSNCPKFQNFILFQNPLITINNLPTPVEKTEELTMKVTYDLYWE